MNTAPRHNSIRTFALICVAVTSVFLMGMAVWYTQLVVDKGWCSRAIGAEQAADGGTRQRSDTAVEACMGLLDKQVGILGLNSHILIGILALCLLSLMVIVVAGGKLSFTGGPKGVSANIGREDDPEQAAQFVADEAQAAADVVAEKPAKPKIDDPDGG